MQLGRAYHQSNPRMCVRPALRQGLPEKRNASNDPEPSSLLSLLEKSTSGNDDGCPTRLEHILRFRRGTANHLYSDEPQRDRDHPSVDVLSMHHTVPLTWAHTLDSTQHTVAAHGDYEASGTTQGSGAGGQ